MLNDIFRIPGDPGGVVALVDIDRGRLSAMRRVIEKLLAQLGAFITESSGHLSEYLPHYRKRADLRERDCRARYDAESSFYADNWPKWREQGGKDRRAMVGAEAEILPGYR